ncbi:CaiB/BaiF CoA transferase family protein [Chloroflexota bacterium]
MLALDNIKVLDLGRGYPAGIASMFLGDFGAQVIRVDPPVGPSHQNRTEKFAAFDPIYRNMKSIILNLQTRAGQQVLYKLARTADVLIENNRPRVMKRLNCDYNTLKEINPQLIYCACSGFGQDGPYADLPAHDMSYIGIAGALSLVGPRDGSPCFPSNFLADVAGCGLHSTIGILIALLAREKTGQGQFVDISYTDSVLTLMWLEVAQYFYTGVRPRRGETDTTGGAAWAQVFKCKDGEYYTIACAEKHLWDNFCRAIGREDLIDKQQATGKEKDLIISDLAKVFATKTRYEWFEFFRDKNTCTGPVNYVDEAFKDPQILHRQMLLEFDHPTVGKVRQFGIPIKLSDTPGCVRTLGSPVGVHTEEVLSVLGYSKEEMEELRHQGVLG